MSTLEERWAAHIQHHRLERAFALSKSEVGGLLREKHVARSGEAWLSLGAFDVLFGEDMLPLPNHKRLRLLVLDFAMRDRRLPTSALLKGRN